MAGKRDFYEVIGVDRNASPDQIKSAFRKLVLKWHPDKWVNASEEEKKSGRQVQGGFGSLFSIE